MYFALVVGFYHIKILKKKYWKIEGRCVETYNTKFKSFIYIKSRIYFNFTFLALIEKLINNISNVIFFIYLISTERIATFNTFSSPKDSLK